MSRLYPHDDWTKTAEAFEDWCRRTESVMDKLYARKAWWHINFQDPCLRKEPISVITLHTMLVFSAYVLIATATIRPGIWR
jgi:hypothetical protein